MIVYAPGTVHRTVPRGAFFIAWNRNNTLKTSLSQLSGLEVPWNPTTAPEGADIFGSIRNCRSGRDSRECGGTDFGKVAGEGGRLFGIAYAVGEVLLTLGRGNDMIEEMRWKFCEESYFRAVV